MGEVSGCLPVLRKVATFPSKNVLKVSKKKQRE